MGTARKTVFFVVVCLLLLLLLAGAALAATPNRVLIVVMDQMQPGYAEEFKMTNVLWLQDNGINYDKAYVGDMASETVVSHNVMVSGMFPKHMGWSDEAIRDVNNVLGFGDIVTTGDLGTVAYEKLIRAAGDYPKLGDYLHAAFPGTIVANVGQKGYQVESMAALSSDIYVRMDSARSISLLPTGITVPWTGKFRGPRGAVAGQPVAPGYTLPDYIKNDSRLYISAGNPVPTTPPTPDGPDVSDTYGTTITQPAWIYPEDGRYAPGPYAGHESGDAWVANAALDIMANENWSGLWVTFSAIDKIGHMWGGGAADTMATYNWDPNDFLQYSIHMPWIAKNADNQLGKLIAEVKAEDTARGTNTLIVVTADHGSTYGKDAGFKGINALNAGNNFNWYAGKWYAGSTTPSTSDGSPALKPLMDTGNVAFSYQSTAIETWLVDQSWGMKLAKADVMRTLPGVIATYVRDGDNYVLTSQSATMTSAERAWWTERGQELVDTMAFSGAADVVGLLADKTSYGAFGDHGGAQMDVQRIPMAFYAPGIKHLVRGTKFRLVDIMPTVLRTMGIAPTRPMDGEAYNLNIK